MLCCNWGGYTYRQRCKDGCTTRPVSGPTPSFFEQVNALSELAFIVPLLYIYLIIVR